MLMLILQAMCGGGPWLRWLCLHLVLRGIWGNCMTMNWQYWCRQVWAQAGHLENACDSGVNWVVSRLYTGDLIANLKPGVNRTFCVQHRKLSVLPSSPYTRVFYYFNMSKCLMWRRWSQGASCATPLKMFSYVFCISFHFWQNYVSYGAKLHHKSLKHLGLRRAAWSDRVAFEITFP